MREGTVRLALVGCLLISAGCANLLGPTTETETLSPAPVPEPTPTPTSPPGVSDGDVRPMTVLAADDRVRSNRSHRVERTLTVEAGDETLRIERIERSTADGRAVGEIRVDGSGPFEPILDRGQFYRDGSLTLFQVQFSKGARANTSLSADRGTPYVIGSGAIMQALVAADLGVTVTDDDSVVVESKEPFTLPARAVPAAAEDVRNVTIRAVVTEEGLLRSVRLRYRAVYDGTPVRVTLRERVSRVGRTTVSRPGWAWIPRTNGTDATAIAERIVAEVREEHPDAAIEYDPDELDAGAPV